MNSLFKKFKCGLFRTAMNSDVKIIAVREDSLYLKIDDETVRVTYNRVGLHITCTCKSCSVVSVARDTFCRRRLRAIHFLFQNSGEISEIQITKEVE